MEFKQVGSIIFENKEYSSEYVRQTINNIKQNLFSLALENECVGVAVERNQNMLCLIMALVESNITFLPIDLSLPENRIHYMLENADVHNVIISSTSQFSVSNEFKTWKLEELLCDKVETVYKEKELNDFTNPVYYLFTSGSTGNPKAVVVNSKGFFNFLKSIPQIIDFTPGERIACFTTVSFDIFFLESVLALSTGLSVILANKDEQNNPKKMIDLILNQKITMMQSTPSRLKLMQIIDPSLDFLSEVKILMVGGESFPNELLKQLQSKTNVRIFNMYGPTETTIWSTVSELTDKESVDIGMPILNTQIYLLQNRETIVNEGDTGEICIGGDGVSDGYYKNKELTDKNFIDLSFAPDTKVYCTGDLGKYENGKLLCLGRIDNQVKINGYRIELEEIETDIGKINEIIDSKVCFDVKNNRLIAFYRAEVEIAAQIFIDNLKEQLPDYMIPSLFVKVDEFKYTANGKIDRKTMIDDFNSKIETSEVVEKNSDLNTSILSIIQESLNSNVEIKIETELESLGINSLTYISIIATLEDEYDMEFEEDYLIQNSFKCVKDIVAYVKERM